MMVLCLNLVVNIMTMDMGEPADPMGNLCVEAAEHAISYLKQFSPNSKLGITPMIGINDLTTEVFQLSDVQAILDFAKSNGDVTYLAFWSLNRDNHSGASSSTSSGFI